MEIQLKGLALPHERLGPFNVMDFVIYCVLKVYHFDTEPKINHGEHFMSTSKLKAIQAFLTLFIFLPPLSSCVFATRSGEKINQDDTIILSYSLQLYSQTHIFWT